MIHKIFLTSCSSTNLEARNLDCSSQSGVAYLVYTLNQTNGRGSLERSWICPSEKSLALSFCIAHKHHKLSLDQRFSLAVAITVVNTLRDFAPLDSKLGWRWPNDIILDGRKLAGILVEWAADRVIVGIGVNLVTVSTDFPPEFAETTAALELNPMSTQFNGMIDSLANNLLTLSLQPPNFGDLIRANLNTFDSGSSRLYITDEHGQKIALVNLTVDPDTGALYGTDSSEQVRVLTSIHSIVYN